MTCKVSHLMPSKGARGPLSHINSLWLIAFSIVLSTRLIAYHCSQLADKAQPWGKCPSWSSSIHTRQGRRGALTRYRLIVVNDLQHPNSRPLSDIYWQMIYGRERRTNTMAEIWHAKGVIWCLARAAEGPYHILTLYGWSPSVLYFPQDW